MLEQKVKASSMRNKSSFLCRQILYGFVYMTLTIPSFGNTTLRLEKAEII